MQKRNSKPFFASLLIASTLMGGLGQLLFKEGLDSSGAHLVVFIVVGLVVYALSTLIYFYTLSRRSLSWSYSFGGLSYIFASILAFLVLGEPVSPLRWIGIGIIAVGTAVIGLS